MSNFRIKGIIDKIKTDAKTRFIVICVCVILLIIIVGVNLYPKNKDLSVSGDVVSEYVKTVEQKLESQLNRIEGAGKVSVAVSVESGMETVLAMTTTTKETSAGREIVSAPLLVNGKTVVLKEVYPKISGVLIVAEGAYKLAVYNKIQQATLSLLDVKASQIEILAMK